jgi:lysophospholipase L1-like esterase
MLLGLSSSAMSGSILRRLLKPILGLSTSVVMLGLIEGGLWLADVPPAGLYEGDLSTVWWLRPGLDTTQRLVEEDLTFTITTNRLGLRGPPPPEEGPWTLALGCSTTFGWGVAAEEAWPAVLSDLTGQTIINGGTPGWSTHQAVLGASRWLDLKPDRVILGYIVRDAQAAPRTDAESRPTPWLMRSHVARLLASRLKAPAAPASPLPAVRVPVDAYRANLERLIAMAGEAEVILLDFPHQEERVSQWSAVLWELPRPVISPKLDSAAFFEHDPIHLNAAGHRALSEQLAADPVIRSTPPLRR